MLQVTMQLRPSLSVTTPPAMQNLAGERLLSPTRTCPSLSWPREPETSPEAVRWKQQLSLRPTKALTPTARDAIAMKLFIVAVECSYFLRERERETQEEASDATRSIKRETSSGQEAKRPSRQRNEWPSTYSLAALFVTGQTTQTIKGLPLCIMPQADVLVKAG